VGRADDEVALVAILECAAVPGPYISQRPVSCHSSAGTTAGISSSMAPARSISSRMMLLHLAQDAQPSGIQV
jgi:hypothetical protein